MIRLPSIFDGDEDLDPLAHGAVSEEIPLAWNPEFLNGLLRWALPRRGVAQNNATEIAVRQHTGIITYGGEEETRTPEPLSEPLAFQTSTRFQPGRPLHESWRKRGESNSRPFRAPCFQDRSASHLPSLPWRKAEVLIPTPGSRVPSAFEAAAESHPLHLPSGPGGESRTPASSL